MINTTLYTSGLGSPNPVDPAVRESRNTGKPNGEPPSETGSRAARAADESGTASAKRKADDSGASTNGGEGFDEAELKELAELKARDREVRTHEAAHQAAGGQHSGAMSLTYQRGPDGTQYAVGGEVSIDIAPVNGDAQATIEKMRVVRSAAMAPAEPSSQDSAVAAQAMQIMLQAQSELASEQTLARQEAQGASKEEPASSQEDSPQSLPRNGQQAKNAYQNVAGFVSEANPAVAGFLPISA